MKTLLLEQDIMSDDILLEEEANSTVQNAIKCNKIIPSVIIVTAKTAGVNRMVHY